MLPLSPAHWLGVGSKVSPNERWCLSWCSVLGLLLALSPAVTPQQFVKLHFPSTPRPNLSSFPRTRISIASRPHATSALPSIPVGRLLFGDCIPNRPSPASARLRSASLASPAANTTPTATMSTIGVRAPSSSAPTVLRYLNPSAAFVAKALVATAEPNANL